VPVSVPGSVLCPAMIGRDGELATLQAAWRSAGRILLVRGSAGIGKSRLVRELASSVRTAGGVVVAGRCSATATDMPFRPLREALLAAARTGLRPAAELAPFRPVLASLVPDWRQTTDASVDSGAIVVAEGLLRLTATWAPPGAATLLIIEDVHWADRETINAIEYLSDNLDGHPVLMVVTQRTGEPGPGAQLMDALIARRVIQPVDLAPLAPELSAAMVSACLSEVILPPDLAGAVVARSDGVPFFIEELLATVIENPVTESPVPGSISAAIEARLGSLPEDTIGFLRYAAVLGRQFDWHVVASASRCPPADALARLRQAAQAQLIDADGEEFRFRHGLTAEAVQSSLLPAERRSICAELLRTLEALHPDLEGDTCQLAGSLAADAGDAKHAAGLWLQAARRAAREGWLPSAEALALRAQPELPVEADRVLLSTWTLAGQPRRALEAGYRILKSHADPSLLSDVRFELADACIAAGRWDEAEDYLTTLRSATGLDRSAQARLAVREAEVSFGRNEPGAAMASARTALGIAHAEGLPEVTCQALWVIGRVERARDTTAAAAAFEQAHACASEHGLPVMRIKSLQELATIGMYETLSVGQLEEARRDALAAGALSITAMVDVALAATYSCRGRADLTLDAAVRSEQVSRQFGLASLPWSLAFQAAAHALTGDRPAMEAAAAAARATGDDRAAVDMAIMGNAVSVYFLGEGQIGEALGELDRAMAVLRTTSGAVYPFPGRWALLRTIRDDGGAEARQECRSLGFDIAMSRAMLLAADAVAAGREGGDAGSVFAAADAALERFEGGFLRNLARLLVAPCARQDGWGEPAAWLREALATFENLSLDRFAVQCRAALRDMGEPVPRRPRTEAPAVPGPLAARGVTVREVEILVQVAAGHSNREMAEALHLSVRTVEKHVERLLMKTGCTRAELTGLAQSAGIDLLAT
jgi:DNA-binding CsgD family transcriptional regulator/tetratricopeptide (TPR) repeat protein